MTLNDSQFNTEEIDPQLILGVLGTADQPLLAAMGVSPEEMATLRQWQNKSGVFYLPDSEQQSLIEHLTSPQFVNLHQKSLDLLSGRLLAGQSAWEPVWDTVFERLASRLYINDTAAFRALCKAVNDLPLTTPLAVQRRAFYQAGVYLTLDETTQATALFDQLLAQNDLVPYMQARTLNARAVLHRIHHEPEAALKGYRQSLALWRQLNDRYYEGIALMNMGIVSYELRHYAEATELFEQAAAIFAEDGVTHWLAVVNNELGLVDRDLGRWDSALDHFERFIEQRQADGADHHVGLGLLNRGEVLLFKGDIAGAAKTLARAQELVEGLRYQIDVHFYLGLVALADRREQEAEAAFLHALALAETADRKEFQPHLYYHLGHLYEQTGRVNEARAAYQAGIAIIESSRQPMSDEQLKISLLGRWQQLYEAIVLFELSQGKAFAAWEWTERARARAFADHIHSGGKLAQTVEFHGWQDALHDYELLISFFTSGVLETDLPLLRALSAEHPLRPVLLTPARIIRFAFSTTDLTVQTIPFDPNFLTSRSPRGQQAARLLQPRIRRQLGQALLANLNFSDVQRVIVMPHGPLHAVPFPAIFENIELLYAPSGTIWHELRQRPQQPLRQNHGGLISFPGRDPHRQLRYADLEAAHLAHQTGSGRWKEEQQSLHKFSSQADWLHFACHGWFDFDRPLASYLEVGPDLNLTAAEILESWRLQAQLVILSACQTGVSRVLRGDEPMGLVRAFLAAGARAVVVTLWPVDDLATYVLMRNFYKALPAQRPAAALHQAQRQLQNSTVDDIQNLLGELPPELTSLPPDQKPFVDPRFWAGFVIVGEG